MARGPMDDSPFRPDADKRRAVGDLRDLVRARCDACLHEWSAPVAGRCPRCRSEHVTTLERAMMNARRV